MNTYRKCISQCREHAKRVYYLAVFEAEEVWLPRWKSNLAQGRGER
jgi:hypothetical protein